jgi:hypothetical protein
MISNSELYKRLQEYKVDFLYSSQSCFNASNRIRVKNEKLYYRRKRLAIFSIILAMLSLSGVALFFTQKFPDLAVGSIGIFSLIAVLVDICLLVDPKHENHDDYQKRGNEYLNMLKEIKNIEVFYSSGKISENELKEEIEKFSEMDNKLRTHPMMLLQEDYDETKKQLSGGNYVHTKEEKKM